VDKQFLEIFVTGPILSSYMNSTGKQGVGGFSPSYIVDLSTFLNYRAGLGPRDHHGHGKLVFVYPVDSAMCFWSFK